MSGEQIVRSDEQRDPPSSSQEGHKASLFLTWEFHYYLGTVCTVNTAPEAEGARKIQEAKRRKGTQVVQANGCSKPAQESSIL